MKRSIHLLIISLVASLLFSCENEQVTQEENNGCCYPLVVKKNGKVLLEFTYNESNKPVTFKEYENGQLTREGKIEYNNQQRASMQYYDASGNPTEYLVYEYNASNNLAKTNYYRRSAQSGNLTLRKRISYLYNQKKQINKEFHYRQIDSSLMLQEYYTYTYSSAGNIFLQKKYNQKGEEITSASFEYDKNPNTYKQLPFINSLHNLNQNNITKAVFENPFGEISTSDSYSSTITYNEYGFPDEERRSFLGGAELVTIEVQYNCNDCK